MTFNTSDEGREPLNECRADGLGSEAALPVIGGGIGRAASFQKLSSGCQVSGPRGVITREGRS